MQETRGFIGRVGVPGPLGALMDEYARMAEELCHVVEQLAPERFEREVAGNDPDTRTIRGICLHVAGAARRYADYIRKARGLEHTERWVADPDSLTRPADLRDRLTDALRYTEGALDGLYAIDEETIAALRFEVRWGPTYDPEMLLEHAIVHLMRHRRQILRWPV